MELSDPDFGEMKYNGIDAWDCRVEFDFPHEKTRWFAIHLWAPANGPMESQRLRFRELKSRYESLWPEIASRIATVHDHLATAGDVSSAMSEWIAVHIGEHSPDSVEFVIDLDLPDEGSPGYFIRLDGWKVGEAIIAE